MATTITLTAKVTDSLGGVSAPVTTNLTAAGAPTAAISVTPTGTQPVGTTYTVTVVGTADTGLTVASGTLTRSDGGAVTPVSGQPAGTFKWTTIF